MNRNSLAYIVLIFSTVAITGLAIVTIAVNPGDTKDIFNTVLPVFASWVGTVLAFYFGRENFESANQQVRRIVEKLAPEERANAKVTSIMRPLRNIILFTLERGQPLETLTISELKSIFGGGCSRLPIVTADQKPMLMLHESVLDHYVASGHSQSDTLGDFITWNDQRGVKFEAGSGFVVVSEETTIAEAKRKMEITPLCQDIFITQEGTANEPLTGWISNLRLAKFLVG